MMHSTTLVSLRKSLLRIRREFRKLWWNYIYQSFLAAVVLLVLILMHTEDFVIIASIASTAYVVFAMPKYTTAQPKRVIGGHLIGLLSGSLAHIIPHEAFFTSAIVYSLTVGLSIFLMVALDFEHPPAAGTALGIAMNSFSTSIFLTVLVSCTALSLAHRLMRRFLKDLT
ncbi:HPP family protein [Chloroflexota bacterium]